MIDSTAHDLYDAMVEPTPCRRDPSDWDADEETPLKTIRELVQQCRTRCPIFDTCARFAATEPPVVGVLAGQYIPFNEGQPLAKAFSADLQYRIHEGEFLPGDMLPSENELATTTGSDRRTIEAAYAALRRSGFIKVKKVRGATVRIVLVNCHAA
ncbi:GntR family transcriptional regulator [Kribbella sp. NPDC056861]|uniref:GntR family transcriptional regulator n=1 Tax=Kribbella sp. NPDC056861 TaxID=3154857 RepID=UPI00341EC8EB